MAARAEITDLQHQLCTGFSETFFLQHLSNFLAREEDKDKEKQKEDASE